MLEKNQGFIFGFFLELMPLIFKKRGSKGKISIRCQALVTANASDSVDDSDSKLMHIQGLELLPPAE